jgi:putative glutamine amidotransferase
VHLSRWTLGQESSALAQLQAVIFSGGNDIDLALYPNPPDLAGEGAAEVMARHRMRPEPERDRYEIPLMQEAVAKDMPVLGICRGCQVMNVALGGRLILDIPIEVPQSVQHHCGPAPGHASGRHAIDLKAGTRLHSALGLHSKSGTVECNSRHHQSVRPELGMPTTVVATAPDDGVVEAIEVPGRRWALGVQWHPEHPADGWVVPRFAPLFAAFLLAIG